MRYPSVDGNRFAVGYHYTSLGYLQYVYDVGENTVDSIYWKANAINPAGQVTDEQTRNGVQTISTRNPSTGWLMARSSLSHADEDRLIQNWAFQYDERGNLRGRSRSDAINVADSTEIFGYDVLDRLKTSEVKIPAEQDYDVTESFGYDNLGNLTSKGGKNYTYTGCQADTRAAGPHAVCTVDNGTPFSYDANGNLVEGNDHSISYNTANKAIYIASHPSVSNGNDTGVVDLIYGADDTRVVQAVSKADGTQVERTIYVGLGGTGRSFYERTTRDGSTEHAFSIYAGNAHGGAAFALRVVTDSDSQAPTTAMKYFHTDHLGSITATSDDAGLVIDALWGGPRAGVMGYDPWGARRNPEGGPANPASFENPAGRRTFTGQGEHPQRRPHQSKWARLRPTIGAISVTGSQCAIQRQPPEL